MVFRPVQLLPDSVRAPLLRVYERRIRTHIDADVMPRHVAVLCDGNRRWARAAGFEDIAHGHRAGAKKISELLGWCDELGIAIVTIYLLSTENLSRDPAELAPLMEIITDVVEEICGPEQRSTVQIVGSLDLLPDDVASRLRAAADRTAGRDGVHVNVAVGYGGRQEIVDAVRSLLRDGIATGCGKKELVELVTVDGIDRHLYTQGHPDPDLVIRTSGEQRLSGFLLWQSAYSEMWFTEVYWPEFRRVDFLRALRSYAARHRRHGK